MLIYFRCGKLFLKQILSGFPTSHIGEFKSKVFVELFTETFRISLKLVNGRYRISLSAKDLSILAKFLMSLESIDAFK